MTPTFSPDPEAPVNKHLQAADDAADFSTCLRRRVGAVLVDRAGRELITSWTRPPADRPACAECHMTTFGIADQTRLDECRGVHAEARCLLRKGAYARGGVLYVVALGPDDLYDPGWPCPICARLALAAGIDAIVIATMRGPRMITPEHLVAAHERGFRSALGSGGPAPTPPHRRAQIDPAARSDPGPGIRMIDHPKHGKMVTANGHDWVFAFDTPPGTPHRPAIWGSR